VTPAFLAIGLVMAIAALACVLVPMLRVARREGRARLPFVLALAIALALPPATLGLYALIGTPAALQTPADTGPTDLAEATAQLRASLARNPDDAQGWALLAQAYSAMDRSADARAALDHLLKLKPDDPDAMVAWAETSAEMRGDHRIDDAARRKLQRALQIDRGNQRALWLLGVSDFQRGRYRDAARRWHALLPLLEPGSKVAGAVRQQLALAEARAGGARGAPTPITADNEESDSAVTRPSTAPGRSIALTVTVKLDPKLSGDVARGDSLFVFARAIDGPPMPLAVARLPASALPAKVTLTDAMAMTPRHKLSDFRRVEVAARIGKSGNPMPTAGDLEAAPVRVATDTRTPIALTIDRVD
jgi:cytochrome c-type biogenesis protein CcmH